MDKATKAALFSAILFPGWGQIYLKHYKRGLIFILPVLTATVILAWTIIEAGASIIRAAPFKKDTVQVSDVLSVTLRAFQSVDVTFFLLMIALLLLLWLLSIIDAYRLGKKLADSPTTAAGQESTFAQQ
jgi:uncharacterized membrane protein